MFWDLADQVQVLEEGFSAGRCQGRWRRQLSTKILQLADAADRGVDAPPTRAGSVQHRPDQREAGVLSGQSTDDLDPAPALAEGALQEVAVPDPLPVLLGKVEVGGQRAEVGVQAVDGARVAGAPLLREGQRPLPATPSAGSPGAASERLQLASLLGQ